MPVQVRVRRPWRSGRNRSPLDEGTLYVARFDPDGTGDWLPLVEGAVPGYGSLAEILIDTRGAAAAVGATKMDRPEWVAVHPIQPGVAYGTFTNNTGRTTPDAANPRAANRFGHILRWQNTDGDHGAETFVWSVFALAGAGLGTGDGSTIAPGDAFGSPDGLAFDNDGRLWIETDGTQPIACNNQMLAADPVTGDIRRFLVGPEGLRDHRLGDDRRPADAVRQHPASRRGRHRPGKTRHRNRTGRTSKAVRVGDAGDPARRRRHDRHLTPALRTSRRSATASPRRGGARLASVGGHRSSG